jgi:hypothetical protein
MLERDLEGSSQQDDGFVEASDPQEPDGPAAEGLGVHLVELELLGQLQRLLQERGGLLVAAGDGQEPAQLRGHDRQVPVGIVRREHRMGPPHALDGAFELELLHELHLGQPGLDSCRRVALSGLPEQPVGLLEALPGLVGAAA